MKTIEEKIAVMQAYADGKKIEESYFGRSWTETTNPAWQWVNYDYRIKPEPKYRPYKNADEFFAEAQKHGWWVILSSTHIRFFVNAYGNTAMRTGSDWTTYEDVLKIMCWTDDGTPCGVLEEEQL